MLEFAETYEKRLRVKAPQMDRLLRYLDSDEPRIMGKVRSVDWEEDARYKEYTKAWEALDKARTQDARSDRVRAGHWCANKIAVRA